MNITKIVDTIKKINANCKEIDELEKDNLEKYEQEKQLVERQSKEMIAKMLDNFNKFKESNFVTIKDNIQKVINTLQKDYPSEVQNCIPKKGEFNNFSFAQAENELYKEIKIINEGVDKFNSMDFDNLVLPLSTIVDNETIITYTGNHENVQNFDYNASERTITANSKPLSNMVKAFIPHCKRAIECVNYLIETYEKEFNINGFNAYVQSSANAWLSELKAKHATAYSTRFDQLFGDEKADAVPKSFFEKLEQDGKYSEVDINTGTSEYKTAINIGELKFLAERDSKHLKYIAESPVLNRYMSDGYISTPMVFDLKKDGNILLNIAEENYSDNTMGFVNQLIMQFLLSFPANRINFCLVDIDNKMDFSKFKSLTRINNGILCNGIIRDDRLLENTIKDMEQTMYKINDDILSYNSVEDIYEYNEKFKANPQNVHLFVLVNYPAGMRDDIAKRVMKIIQNGKKAGIFTIIINNKHCSLNPSYKQDEYNKFVENLEKSALVIDKKNDKFTIDMQYANSFEPKPDIYLPNLNSIVEMLKDSAESNRQQVVPLKQMFDESDKIAASPKGIPSSAEVLDIPIGARGGEVQNLLLKTTGDGSAHAVLIGGTGSGKSNLLHTIIMSACFKYSPEELNLYLVDFKGGVEFKFYEANKVKEKQLPHIKLTGLTSDLEDGVAILYNLQKELRRREDEFRTCRVEDIVQYRNTGKKIPRLFVIIDEIQELFEQDDKLGQKAIDILRELFKKGRAFGINILWASQNVPKVPGLKDRVLSQIGNRISLRLNEPEDALDIKIDPKIVKNLNRPEKGLGVINDIRYGNDSIEFRVAYAETSENRQKYANEIIEKWQSVTAQSAQEPLFIVGDDEDASPIDGNTIYNLVPNKNDIVSKSFDSYKIQLGQDYVTGKPFNINLALRENKMNMLFVGYDVEILRDMMGYSLLSVIMEHSTNADCVAENAKISYANGEMINPKNSNDLFNVLRNDFKDMVSNVSSVEQFTNNIKDLYKIYKQRNLESDNTEYANAYAPYFIVIHSIQRYIDVFNDNPLLHLTNVEQSIDVAPPNSSYNSKLEETLSIFASVSSMSATPKNNEKSTKMPDQIYFADAFKELLNRGGKFGIHFIISIDNPFAISAIKNDITEIMYKIFVKGINANIVSQMLGDYRVSNSLNNPKVALVATQDEKTKIRVYRYDDSQDEKWYKTLCTNYKELLEN